MTVWTVLCSVCPTCRDYDYSTPTAHTMFASPDSNAAWTKAEQRWGTAIIAIWKGDFARQVVTEKP
jgi:hypothetical protein